MNKILFILNEVIKNKDNFDYKEIIYSLFINEYLGYDIISSNNHYYVLIDNSVFDFINCSKKAEYNSNDYIIVSRESLLTDDITNLYNNLKKEVDILINKFNLIDKKINMCDRCTCLVERFESKNSISYGLDNKVLILGEAPANNGWRKSGVAWYDENMKLLPSGKVLKELLSLININLEDTFFIEAIKCYPIKRSNLNICKKNCRDYLFSQLELINPKVIITLGDYATKSILDIKYNKFSDVVGKVYKANGMVVIPIYHPSPISPLSYKGNVPIFNDVIKKYI